MKLGKFSSLLVALKSCVCSFLELFPAKWTHVPAIIFLHFASFPSLLKPALHFLSSCFLFTAMICLNEELLFLELTHLEDVGLTVKDVYVIYDCIHSVRLVHGCQLQCYVRDSRDIRFYAGISVLFLLGSLWAATKEHPGSRYGVFSALVIISH